MNRTLRLLPLLTAVVLLGAGQASADPIDFSYSWTVLPTSVFPSGGAGTGSITIAAAPDGTTSAERNSSTPTFVPGATVTTTSTAESPPDTYNANFSMTLRLTDALSTQAADLTFTGTLFGTLTGTGVPSGSSLTATFENSVEHPFTQTVTLGNFDYTVTIRPTLLNLPAPGGTESIEARVTVADHNVVDPPHQTPEPTSLVLGATAVLGFAMRRLWARRRAQRG